MTGPGNESRRGKLLFCSVDLNPPGGGQCVGAWALQALQRDWDITILCATRPDCDALNRHFGTRLEKEQFRFVQLPWPIRNIHRLDPDPHSIQRAAFLMRKARQLRNKFDVTMAVDNEMDFGRPGIQYVHFPYLSKHRERVDAIRRLSPAKRMAELFKWRYRPWMLVSGVDFDRICSNLTLVNSAWSANVVQGLYDEIHPAVLYPPVHWSAPSVPWEKRENSLVSLGRIEPGKRQVEAIDIVEQVRQRGHDVRLEIIGDIADRDYANRLRERALAAGSWVQLHHGISRSELEQRVGRCRYGLHTMQEEHFGIAVAEMVRAGCAVFVPGNGGQVEIIGHEPGLMFDSNEQAVERICAVLGNDELQSRLLQKLARCSHEFTEEGFMRQLRTIVQNFAREHGPQLAS